MEPLKEYDWWGGSHEPPESLKTKTQLAKIGLKPLQAAGVISTRKYDVLLFDVRDPASVQPKRQMSEKQKQSLERMLLAREHRQKQKEWEREVYPYEYDRLLSIGRCKEILKSTNFVILDTETTGLGKSEIIEISIVDHQKQPILNTLVKPLKSITTEAIAIHGITNEMVANAPSFPDIYPDLVSAIAGKQVLIYNDGFDVKVINHCCKLHNLQKLKINSACLMLLYARFYGEYSDYLGGYKWQPLDGGHRALSDCLAAFKLLEKMANSAEKMQPPYPEYMSSRSKLIQCDRINAYLEGDIHPNDYQVDLPYSYHPDSALWGGTALVVSAFVHSDAIAYGWHPSEFLPDQDYF